MIHNDTPIPSMEFSVKVQTKYKEPRQVGALYDRRRLYI
jgi:hypothetical protein